VGITVQQFFMRIVGIFVKSLVIRFWTWNILSPLKVPNVRHARHENTCPKVKAKPQVSEIEKL